MSYPIKFPCLSGQIEYYDEVNELHKEAIGYLTSFQWCSRIEGCDLYLNLGEKLCLPF